MTQTDTRIASIEVNIKKLDGELMRYKEQMSKLRNGPGKVTSDCLQALLHAHRPTQKAIEQRALRVLRQRKMYEAQLAQLAQQTFNMQSAAIATENLQNTMATVDAMKLANKEIKKQYGKIDIDKIEVRGAFGRMPRLARAKPLDGRICISTWRNCWSRQTRYRSP